MTLKQLILSIWVWQLFDIYGWSSGLIGLLFFMNGIWMEGSGVFSFYSGPLLFTPWYWFHLVGVPNPFSGTFLLEGIV